MDDVAMVAETALGNADEILANDRQYVIHPWSVQSQISPMLVTRAEGVCFWDHRGRRYLDFASQLVNLNVGHQHPRVIAAIKEQADRQCTIAPTAASEPVSTLARILAEITPGDLSMSFFTNGGAEANESAVKVARWYTGRQKIVTRYRSYHGATAGAMTLSGDPRRLYAEPGIPGVVRILDPYCYRCPAGHRDRAHCPVCSGAPHLEEILAYEGADTVAAVIIETITGGNGYHYPPDGYLQSVRETCSRHGILLILDEIMVGFGRTGQWFAFEHWNIRPDILTVAKGLTSGYVPLGAMIVSEPIGGWLRDRMFGTGLTFASHPLACAAGIANIQVYRDERLIERAAEHGEFLGPVLQEIAARHPSVGDIRGAGLFWGLELVKNRHTREPLVPFRARGEEAKPMQRFHSRALGQGLLLHGRWNVVGIAPPLVISREELDEGLSIIDDCLAVADEYSNE